MQRLTIGLLFSAVACFAQTPIIDFGPILTEKSHSFATFYWSTSNVASTHRVEYGLTSSYGQTSEAGGNSGLRTNIHHGYMMSGLAPNTTYHYRVCSSTVQGSCSLNGASPTCACSPDATVTTDPEPDIHPAPPTAPATFSTAMPPLANEAAGEWNLTATGKGRILTLNSSCETTAGTKLSAVLTALASFNPQPTNTDTLEIRIPPGAVCQNTYTFPNRPNHAGWVVVRPTTSAGVPPEGHRAIAADAANMPTIRTDASWVNYVSPNGMSSTCTVGDSGYLSTTFTGTFPLYECQPGGSTTQAVKSVTGYDDTTKEFTVMAHGYLSGEIVNMTAVGIISGGNLSAEITVTGPNTFTVNAVTQTIAWSGGGTVNRRGAWRRVNFLGKLTSGTSLPNTCTEGNWFEKTNDPASELPGGYLCIGANRWEHHRFATKTTTAEWAAIRTGTSAKRYRFVGLNVTRTDGKLTTANGLNPFENKMGSLVYIDRTAEDIILDRCLMTGGGAPNRTSYGVLFDGSRVGVINSWLSGIDHWLGGSVTGSYEAYGINVSGGPGPGIIENNYLEATGITLFWQEGGSNGPVASDYIVRRNTFTSNIRTKTGDAQSDGYYYMRRHHWEVKRAKRVSTIGNRFSNSWQGVNKGEFVEITPTGAPPQTVTISLSTDSAITTSSLSADWRRMGVSVGNPVWVRITGSSGGVHDGAYRVASVHATSNIITLENGPTGSSTGGTLATITSATETSDLDFQWNTFAHGGMLTGVIGMHNHAGGALPTRISKRIRMANNLIYDLNAKAWNAGGWSAGPPSNLSGGSPASSTVSVWYGQEDYQFFNNTLDGVQSTSTANVYYADSGTHLRGPLEGFVVRDNLFIGPSSLRAANRENSVFGTAALDSLVRRVPNPAWVYTGNAFCCGLAETAIAGNTYIASAGSLGIFSQAQNNYRFKATSSYFRSGKGVDMDELERQQGLAKNARVLEVSDGNGRICVDAPDAAPVIVRLGSTERTLEGEAGNRCTSTIPLGSGATVFVGTQRYSCPPNGGNCSLVN